MKRGDAGVQQQFAVRLAIESIGFQKQPLALECAQQIALGQRRALVGAVTLLADQGDGAVKALGAQALHRLGACLAGADNDEFP